MADWSQACKWLLDRYRIRRQCWLRDRGLEIGRNGQIDKLVLGANQPSDFHEGWITATDWEISEPNPHQEGTYPWALWWAQRGRGVFLKRAGGEHRIISDRSFCYTATPEMICATDWKLEDKDEDQHEPNPHPEGTYPWAVWLAQRGIEAELHLGGFAIRLHIEDDGEIVAAKRKLDSSEFGSSWGRPDVEHTLATTWQATVSNRELVREQNPHPDGTIQWAAWWLVKGTPNKETIVRDASRDGSRVRELRISCVGNLHVVPIVLSEMREGERYEPSHDDILATDWRLRDG